MDQVEYSTTRLKLKVAYLREVKDSRARRWQALALLSRDGASSADDVEEARLAYLKALLDLQLVELDQKASQDGSATQ